MIEKAIPNPNNFVLSQEELSAVDQKTIELYEKRIAPYVKDISSNHKEAIINCQRMVFILDYYFEHTEAIDPAILNSFLIKIEKFLDDLGMSKESQTTLIQDLKDYADIETSTRKGKKLVEYDIDFFYFKKSCDVRMQRHIARYLNQQTMTSSKEEIAKDIVEEILDDVEDIEEDKLTPFNGNRFLEALNSKDTTKLQEYIAFLNSLTDVPQSLVQKVVKKIQAILKS